ncbi:NfeD family protein [Allorhizobium sp. BGMRC 0089]|uniref:NfeD family protein n=1 Tax=Allorhizobium sonneratiae TaxID=2934936 RepID=UPI0020339994|nr:NfeD family protein [Allorhizobium sonneratiae]MCM2290855.1 NfeD family protein [Allorhizobium sonneratiae]
MIIAWVNELGLWSWWVGGLILLAAELMMPGMFLVWFGMAALLTGILSLVFWGASFWPWQVQMLVFAALSLASILIGRRILVKDRDRSDEPLLNQRTASLVGRTATLESPIREGRGRIRLDDTFWTVNGPDLAAGVRVKIVAAHGRELTVEAV